MNPPPSDSVHHFYGDLNVECDSPPAYSGTVEWSLKINNAGVTAGGPPPQLELTDPTSGQKQTMEGTVSPVTRSRVVWSGTADFTANGTQKALIRNVVLDPSIGTEGDVVSVEVRANLPTQNGACRKLRMSRSLSPPR